MSIMFPGTSLLFCVDRLNFSIRLWGISFLLTRAMPSTLLIASSTRSLDNNHLGLSGNKNGASRVRAIGTLVARDNVFQCPQANAIHGSATAPIVKKIANDMFVTIVLYFGTMYSSSKM
ncbi:unnamed protein product [Chrysodeixis includens]|uniref:Uncharacterized protein n=1 Tax=Chrysodeixis includens TaxID=689277 RepID=A0A9P0BJW4_CHRIL|nr:unnamed protein product [Chrysodeixis includens]